MYWLSSEWCLIAADAGPQHLNDSQSHTVLHTNTHTFTHSHSHRHFFSYPKDSVTSAHSVHWIFCYLKKSWKYINISQLSKHTWRQFHTRTSSTSGSPGTSTPPLNRGSAVPGWVVCSWEISSGRWMVSLIDLIFPSIAVNVKLLKTTQASQNVFKTYRIRTRSKREW